MFLLTDDFWEIKQTKEKGWGVFAKKEIQAATIIGDYLGKVVKTADYDLNQDKHGLYLMYFSDQAAIYPDLTQPGLHLLNHACSPNCWIYIYKGHTLIFALRNIKPGEELTISYLLSPNDKTCDPCIHTCKCGSKFCTGTMHLTKGKYAKWQAFQNIENKKTKRSKIVFGKNLSPLSSFPKINPHNPIYALIANNKFT